jgi:hypothetical protein
VAFSYDWFGDTGELKEGVEALLPLTEGCGKREK